LAVESEAEQDRADHDQNQEDCKELHPAHRALPYGAAMTHNANVRGTSTCSGPASLLLLAQLYPGLIPIRKLDASFLQRLAHHVERPRDKIGARASGLGICLQKSGSLYSESTAVPAGIAAQPHELECRRNKA
jgi:hypothetical protein